MSPTDFLTQVLMPGLAWLEQTVGAVPPPSKEARLLMLAIAGQESNWDDLQQSGGGPGRGFFQMEPPTCRDILENPASDMLATKVCMALTIVPSRVYESLIVVPTVAVAFARLDLWCDPYPLPAYGDEAHSWHYYNTCWRPGKPRPADWPRVYAQAFAADKGNP